MEDFLTDLILKFIKAPAGIPTIVGLVLLFIISRIYYKITEPKDEDD